MATSKIDLLLIFLAEMRKEQKDDHDELKDQVVTALKQLSEHETRITVVEGRQKAALWTIGALVAGGIGFLFDLAKNHLK